MNATTPRNKTESPFYKDSAEPAERILPKQQMASDRSKAKYRDKGFCRSDWYRLARYIGAFVISRYGHSVPDFQLLTSILKELKGDRLKGHELRLIPVSRRAGP